MTITLFKLCKNKCIYTCNDHNYVRNHKLRNSYLESQEILQLVVLLLRYMCPNSNE